MKTSSFYSQFSFYSRASCSQNKRMKGLKGMFRSTGHKFDASESLQPAQPIYSISGKQSSLVSMIITT
jgi:hypothetical protein